MVEFVSSITRHDITWDFDQQYSAGQYINGDWWVSAGTGTVTVTSITQPAATTGRDGSMINPFRAEESGHDNRQGAYQSSLNAALDLPTLVLSAGDSLVSVISDPTGFPPGNIRTYIQSASVLTCVSAAPPDNSYRPTFWGPSTGNPDPSKKLTYSASNVFTTSSILPNLDDLPERLEVPAEENGRFLSPSTLANVETMFDEVWFDSRDVLGGIPWHSMPDYGREVSQIMSFAAMYLCTDKTVVGDVSNLLHYLIQIGIDVKGAYENSGDDFEWEADGGINHGRKFPLILAGLMLNDSTFSSLSQTIDPKFHEDGQTFYVQETSPGVYNNGFGGYVASDVGRADWGIRHDHEQDLDEAVWQTSHGYRRCCGTYAQWGWVTAADKIPGMRQNWNHEALFDYTKIYREKEPIFGSSVYLSVDSWGLAFYDANFETGDVTVDHSPIKIPILLNTPELEILTELGSIKVPIEIISPTLEIIENSQNNTIINITIGY